MPRKKLEVQIAAVETHYGDGRIEYHATKSLEQTPLEVAVAAAVNAGHAVADSSFIEKFMMYRERYKAALVERDKLKDMLNQHSKAVTNLTVSVKAKEGDIASLKGVIDKLIER